MVLYGDKSHPRNTAYGGYHTNVPIFIPCHPHNILPFWASFSKNSHIFVHKICRCVAILLVLAANRAFCSAGVSGMAASAASRSCWSSGVSIARAVLIALASDVFCD